MWIIHEDCTICVGHGSYTTTGLTHCSECHGSRFLEYREEDYNYITIDHVKEDYPNAYEIYKTKCK